MNANLYINGSIFSNNFALIGGAIYYQISLIQISSSSFVNNTAQYYGQTLYSYPNSLKIINETQNIAYANNSFIINSFRSGGVLPVLIVHLFDEENNTIIPVPNIANPSITLKLVSNLLEKLNFIYSISENSISMSDNGSFVISNLILIGKPTDSVNIIISSNSIYTPYQENQSFIQNYNYSFSVQLRSCIIGEIYQNLTGTCFPCGDGTFSFDIDSTCNTCLDGMICVNQSVLVQSGYWRFRNFSLSIMNCYNNPDACIGGASSGNDVCLKGHIGARCESCDLMGKVWGIYYSRASGYGCVDCNDLTYNYLILAFLSIVNFLSMSFSIIGTIKNIEQTLKLKVIAILSRYSMLKTFNNESSIYIKIYLCYFQILQVLSTFQLTYPSWTSVLTVTVGNPTQSSLYSTDCLIKYLGNFIPYIYIKLVIALLVPVIYFIIFSLGYTLFISRFKIHRKFAMLYTASLFTLIYFQPTVIESTISVLSCITIGENTYIKADVSYLCNTSDYWFYSFIIGIPSLFLWGFFVPLIILWRLIANKKDLNEIRMKTRYGYIYGEYRIFFWEFIKMYEKIFITLFLQFYDTEILIKGLLILITIAIYFVLVTKFRPYKTTILTKVDQITTIVLYVTIFLGLLSYKNNFTYIVNISYIIILFINLLYNLFMISQILQTYSASFEKYLEKIRNIAPFLFFMKKEIQTLEKWRLVRRAVARYLRERERRKMEKKLDDAKEFNLSIEDYNPAENGIKRINNKKYKTHILLKKSSFNFNGDDEIFDEGKKSVKLYETKNARMFQIASSPQQSFSGKRSEEESLKGSANNSNSKNKSSFDQ